MNSNNVTSWRSLKHQLKKCPSSLGNIHKILSSWITIVYWAFNEQVVSCWWLESFFIFWRLVAISGDRNKLPTSKETTITSPSSSQLEFRVSNQTISENGLNNLNKDVCASSHHSLSITYRYQKKKKERKNCFLFVSFLRSPNSWNVHFDTTPICIDVCVNMHRALFRNVFDEKVGAGIPNLERWRIGNGICIRERTRENQREAIGEPPLHFNGNNWRPIK